jgi:hypothetical protein
MTMAVEPGFYRHYKGHAYFVFGVAELKHEGNRRVVHYCSVKSSNERCALARDEREFEELVESEYVGADGHAYVLRQPRFARLEDPEESVLPRPQRVARVTRKGG